MSRPEHLAPPEIFYNDSEASKYTENSRIQAIQASMTERCLELLALPASVEDPSAPRSSLILDIGCGSGLSGEIIEEAGHHWIGCDISASMLQVALEREVSGDLFLQDIGQGFGFRAGSFDGAISVSVLQWLCNADATDNSPPQRLQRFFTTLIASLSRGARAVFQFYPESDEQVTFIMSFATRAGFGGGLVVDFPNSRKAKKYYLVLQAGQPDQRVSLPRPLGEDGQLAPEEEEDRIVYERRRKAHAQAQATRQKSKPIKGSRRYIEHKKDLNRLRGKEVPRDSKYTGRRRRVAF